MTPCSVLPPRSTLRRILSSSQFSSQKKDTNRQSPGGSFDPHIYICVIEIPRGVPNEFKAKNQRAAGFRSVLFWWFTINKNVDWVNFIYYNQQRFVNHTRDATKGITKQLDATSQVALKKTHVGFIHDSSSKSGSLCYDWWPLLYFYPQYHCP
jgi:hypothetical protein